MDDCDNLNWFAIRTKRFREAVAASSIESLGLEAFLPMVKVDCPDEAVIKVESKPLFPCYFFARFDPVIFLNEVESARGVLYVIKSGNPIPIDGQIIREIRDRLEPDGLIRLQRREPKPGSRVEVQRGPFASMIGRVEMEMDDGKRVAVLMEIIGQTRVLVEKRWLELETA